jgi:hypothetical protein
VPDIDDLIMATQARVTVRQADTALLDAAKKRAPDPSIFDTYPPFLWTSEISSDRLDAYYTVMDAGSTLPNYASDAAEGVAILIGHDTRSLPIGASLSGTLERLGDGARVTSDAYALLEPATDAVISRIRAGIARDISVGFSTRGATCMCSICGRDMWRDWDCWHIPGFEYEKSAAGSDGSNGSKVMTLATGLIVDAHLSEYSLVYDGATPGAAVLQAQRAAEAGRMTVGQARLIEQRYRINLPGKRLIIQGGTMPPESNGHAAAEERELQSMLELAGVPGDRTGLDRVRWLVEERARVAPLAEDGRTYRADLVTTAEAEAVRALGAEQGAAQRAMLEASPISLVKSFTQSWRAIGDSQLTGGRKSTDEGNPEPGTWIPRTPDLMY